MNLETSLVTAPTPVLVTGAALAVLVVAFFAVFLGPGFAHWLRLRRIQQDIANFEAKDYPAEFRKVFAGDKQLAHHWKEYQESLHVQREERGGQMVVRAVRATAPAELYFNSQTVVDSRLRTEFFKHLPGIFTGIGIIGTFSGLIEGLRAFQVSENAATVRTSLESLMHSVGEAFLVSAAAIAAAMVVTFIEKLLLASLYRKTEEIAHAIDACFEAGAGEEYLSRLVKASEESASQSKLLKDALVEELGELLRELTSAQIAAGKEQQAQVVERLVQASREQLEAARQDNQVLGNTIAESIQQSLKGPLEDIASTVRTASGDQSATAARMLQDIMASFSQRLNDLFGGQISGLNELNQQTARSMQDAVGTLQALVANIEASSQRSTDAMAQRMAEAIEKIESRQEAMNAQSAAFIEQIRQLVATSQSETNQKLQGTLEAIGTQVTTMLARLSGSQQEVFESNRAREQSMADRASSIVTGMSESVEAAIKELGAATSQMAQSVTTLTQVTSSSVDKMNAGAEQLGTASRNFATAGERVTSIMGQVTSVSTKLSETSGSLTAGATAIQELLKDYRNQRDAISQLVTELRATVEAARKEATLTSDILGRIEGSANRLGAAQKQADEYLDGVSRVLGEAHTSFATEVKRTLDKANTEFHTKLSTAVGLLHSAVAELEVTLASMGSLAPVRR
ncbi:TerC family integral membrane protein [Ralstonia sp. A12]|uniref:anti-phage ZorAB system protein ZorA n=1 Tax=Ralstonia sp. A12 TaxID=1217052 RepID=UPI000574A3E9|nr:anti-phage ZorAB system protein ZorA [Ralstonia sp. A12]KHK57292.1 TerC family integral membrane protein [Ralstonia sp. A12]